jgi:N-acylneuraminate cytidylyltransferase
MRRLATAVIPARGGSKRIPRKNIKLFRGRPLIAYAIEAAIESELFERVVVSTDDSEIADISIAFGAEIPFLREQELSNDHVMTVPVIADAIQKLDIQDKEVVCCIYPTAALLMPDELKSAMELLFEHPSASYICAVTEYGYPIQRALNKNSEGILNMIRPEFLETRSQDLEPTYHDVGMFYFAFAATWKLNLPMLLNAVGLPIQRWKAQDLDTDEDWARLEIIRSIIELQADSVE